MTLLLLRPWERLIFAVTPEGAVVRKCRFGFGTIVIPGQAEIDDATFPVVGISTNAFANQFFLKGVDIPGSIMNIEEAAFANCYAMDSIYVPSSVTNIGANAFSSCRYLTRAEVTSTNRIHFGAGVFSGCAFLSDITLPETLEEIPPWTFASCNSLRAVNLPLSVTGIGVFAFGFDFSLGEVHLPVHLSKIGPMAFYNCISLTNVVFSGTIQEIEDRAFENCVSLNPFSLPDGSGDEANVFAIDSPFFPPPVNNTTFCRLCFILKQFFEYHFVPPPKDNAK